MKKVFRITIYTALIGGAIYFFLSKDNTSRYTFPNFGPATKDLVVSSFKRIWEGVASVAPQILDKAAEKGGELISETEQKIKNQAFDILKQSANDKINDFGSRLGVEIQKISTNQETQQNSVSLAMKTGTAVYFTIKNYEDKQVSYEVDWLDGEKGTGQIESGETKVVSHKWSRAGDYNLKFRMFSLDGEKKQQIFISIIK